MKQETNIDLRPDIEATYFISSLHRKRGNPNKSIWTITMQLEVDCFKECIKSNWTQLNLGWGLLFSENGLIELGVNNSGDTLKIAKFIDGNKDKTWHGYPADCAKKMQDIPPTKILLTWAELKFITKNQLRKIKQQQPCNL